MATSRGGAGGRTLVTAVFLAPALILLIVWIVYPVVYTMWRSLYDRSGDNFIWLDNYQTLFSTDTTRTAIKNNAIWVAVVPALVTAVGLVFAVLTERIRWSVAFKIAVFMPMAISLFAAGVIWRIMDQQEPSRGAVNAVIATVHDHFVAAGPALRRAAVGRQPDRHAGHRASCSRRRCGRVGVALLPLTGIPPDQVPAGSKQAVLVKGASGEIRGVVWRDFKPGGGTPGKLEQRRGRPRRRDRGAARLVREDRLDDQDRRPTGLRVHRRRRRHLPHRDRLGHVQAAVRRRLVARARSSSRPRS